MHEKRREEKEITVITETLTKLPNLSFLTDNCLTVIIIFQPPFIEIKEIFEVSVLRK